MAVAVGVVTAMIGGTGTDPERITMTLKPGQYIRHSKYGCGTIVTRDDSRTTVDFDTAGVKLFVTAMAAFEPAEGEAPKRKRPSSRARAKAAASQAN